jgi:predicted GNAT family N-acyltransferase
VDCQRLISKISLASDIDLISIQKLRHEVFLHDGHLEPLPDSRVIDEFDNDLASNFFIKDNNSIIAAVRFTPVVNDKFPTASYFDFKKLNLNTELVAVNYFVVKSSYQGQGLGKILMLHAISNFKGKTGISAVNPDSKSLWQATGWVPVGPEGIQSISNRKYLPMINNFPNS